MTKDEALDLALEALEHLQPTALTSFYTIGARDKAITAIKQARSAPVQDIDWKDMYEKEKRRSEMWAAKYEKDIGPLEYAVPVAAPVQEPFGYFRYDMRLDAWVQSRDSNRGTAFYITPPAAQRQWVGLTPREIYNLWEDSGVPFVDWDSFASITRAIEAKLKDKNGLHRQHVIDGSPCWCEPETSYTDPETGASVVVHKEPQ